MFDVSLSLRSLHRWRSFSIKINVQSRQFVITIARKPNVDSIQKRCDTNGFESGFYFHSFWVWQKQLTLLVEYAFNQFFIPSLALPFFLTFFFLNFFFILLSFFLSSRIECTWKVSQLIKIWWMQLVKLPSWQNIKKLVTKVKTIFRAHPNVWPCKY